MHKNRFLIIGQLPPPVHGSTVMTELFIKSLQKLGHEVAIIQKTFSRTADDVERFSILKIFKVPVIGFRLLRQILWRKPEICFYFNSFGLTSFLVDALYMLILRVFGVPYILYCHGKGLRKLGSDHNWFLAPIIRNTIGKAFGALVLGERLKEDLIPYLSPRRLYVLPNSIPENGGIHCRPDNDDKDLVRVLFLSNLVPEKGPLEFLQMAKEVTAHAPQVRFTLAGPKMSEDFHQKLVDFLDQAGLKDLVHVPGGLYGDAKKKAFQKSDIFVFPTYYKRETFGLVNLEAMQWGLPVISSPEGAIPEVVLDGKTGYIVNPRDISQLADRVLRLVQDRDLRLQMGKESRKRYEEFFTIEAYQSNLKKALEFFQEKILHNEKRN